MFVCVLYVSAVSVEQQGQMGVFHYAIQVNLPPGVYAISEALV